MFHHHVVVVNVIGNKRTRLRMNRVDATTKVYVLILRQEDESNDMVLLQGLLAVANDIDVVLWSSDCHYSQKEDGRSCKRNEPNIAVTHSSFIMILT